MYKLIQAGWAVSGAYGESQFPCSRKPGLIFHCKDFRQCSSPQLQPCPPSHLHGFLSVQGELLSSLQSSPINYWSFVQTPLRDHVQLCPLSFSPHSASFSLSLSHATALSRDALNVPLCWAQGWGLVDGGGVSMVPPFTASPNLIHPPFPSYSFCTFLRKTLWLVEATG